MVQAILYFLLVLLSFFTFPINSIALKIVIAIPFIIFIAISLKGVIGKYRAGFTIGSMLILIGYVLGEIWRTYLEMPFLTIVFYFLFLALSLIGVIANLIFIYATKSREKEIKIENKVKEKTFKEKFADFKGKLKNIKGLYPSLQRITSRRTYSFVCDSMCNR